MAVRDCRAAARPPPRLLRAPTQGSRMSDHLPKEAAIVLVEKKRANIRNRCNLIASRGAATWHPDDDNIRTLSEAIAAYHEAKAYYDMLVRGSDQQGGAP